MRKLSKGKGKMVGKKETGPSRARAPRKPSAKASAPAVVDRVQEIAALMAKGRWTAKMAVVLGERWGLEPATVQKASAEASRQVRGYLLPPVEETRTLLVGRLDEAYALARRSGDAKAMVAAVLAHDKVTGASGPQKVALTTAKGEDLPEYVRRDWPVEVWQWALAQGRVVGEAEMAAKAEELAGARE